METRTVYLKTKNGITYSSDPLDTMYLDISEIDNLNPEYDDAFFTNDGSIGVYDTYSTSITLTFNDREERSKWITDNAGAIVELGLRVSAGGLVYAKRALVSGVDFTENEFVNGVQAIMNVTLFGKWQGAFNEVPTTTGDYVGGDKQYTEPAGALMTYQYDYQYGDSHFANVLTLDGNQNRFLIVLETDATDAELTFTNYKLESVTLTTTQLAGGNSLSSDFVTYPISWDLGEELSLLTNGAPASSTWDGITENYRKLYNMLNDEIQYGVTVVATTGSGIRIPFRLFSYGVHDFI